MNYYMGIDIGTSGCKAAVFDSDGLQISLAYHEYQIISENEGWAELDPEEVIRKCFLVIKESAMQVAPDTITGIGISSQGEAFALLDQEGKILCNALVSSDNRANEYSSGWAEKFGEEKLYQVTGHTPHPMFSLFKLLWIKDHWPRIWEATCKILCFEDFLQYRLGLSDPAMGWPLAGRTMLFDVINHCWSPEILDAAGISETQLSRPLQSGSVAGRIDPGIAKKLGLKENTFIVTGGHDQPCCGLGAGAILPGIAVYSAGTVDCITPAFNNPVFKSLLRESNLCTYDHVVGGMYATVAFSLTGGNILKWFKEEFGRVESDLARETDEDTYDLLLNQLPENPTKLIVLPYFTPTGTPYFDSSAKGAVIGLDLTTKRNELLKALLEGVALEMKLNLEILEQSGYQVNELRVIGRGARSQVWNQLKSDIIGKPITVINVTEAGCKGAAMLVKAAHTGQPASEIAAHWTKIVTRLIPDVRKSYDQKFLTYKKLYPALKIILANQYSREK